MGEVTQIGARPDTIFVCQCGCSTWRLLNDATVECAACENRSMSAAAWYEEKPKAPEFDGEPFVDIQGNGSVEFARSRLQRMAADPDLSLIVLVRENGTIHMWSNAETKKRIKWTVQRLKQAADLLKRRVR